MPGMDGFELARRIRFADEPDRPLVVLLAGSGSCDHERCGKAGVAACLSKPAPSGALRRALIEALRGQQQRRQHRAPPTRAECRGPAKRPPGRLLRILLAEDNAINQHLARKLLEARGHMVALANNGREAVQLCERQTSISC